MASDIRMTAPPSLGPDGHGSAEWGWTQPGYMGDECTLQIIDMPSLASLQMAALTTLASTAPAYINTGQSCDGIKITGTGLASVVFENLLENGGPFDISDNPALTEARFPRLTAINSVAVVDACHAVNNPRCADISLSAGTGGRFNGFGYPAPVDIMEAGGNAANFVFASSVLPVQPSTCSSAACTGLDASSCPSWTDLKGWMDVAKDTSSAASSCAGTFVQRSVLTETANVEQDTKDQSQWTNFDPPPHAFKYQWLLPG